MTATPTFSSGATAVLFTGQGAQRAGMADGWAAHPVSAPVLADASLVLGYDVVDRCRDPEALARTEVAQPALFVCGIAAWRVLESQGHRPDVVAGHSLGEWTALVAAGLYPFLAALEMVVERANAMAEAATERPGTMTAVIGPDAHALAVAAVEAERHATAESEGGDALGLANHNGPRQVVLSGTVAAIERAEALVHGRGGRAKRLQVAGAFHSPLMTSAAALVEAVLDRTSPATPDPWVVPNVTGAPTRDPDLLVRLLRRHLLAPVLWTDTVGALAAMGVTRVIECGPRPVLTALTRPTLPDAEFDWVSDPEAASRISPRPPNRPHARLETAR